MSGFVPVSDELLAEVESNTRSKGQYAVQLGDYLAAGIRAAQYERNGDKPTANSIKTGLVSAIDKLAKADEDSPAKYVQVKIYKDQVFLVRSDLS